MPIPLSVFEKYVLHGLSCRPKHAHLPLPKYSFYKHYACIFNALLTTKMHRNLAAPDELPDDFVFFLIRIENSNSFVALKSAGGSLGGQAGP